MGIQMAEALGFVWYPRRIRIPLPCRKGWCVCRTHTLRFWLVNFNSRLCLWYARLSRSLSSRAFSVAARSGAFDGGIQWTCVGHDRSLQPETSFEKATGQVTSTPNKSCVRQFPPRSAAPIIEILRRSRGEGNRISGRWCEIYHRDLL